MSIEQEATGGEGPPVADQSDAYLLDADERRVIGVLIEKSLTTPNNYPLTVNALVSGCNQKSNRDPFVQFVDDEVEEILQRLQLRGLVTEHYGAGGRVAKWRQEFTYELEYDGPQMAVIAELLLRGPQTLGELRTRASRMKPIADLGTLDGLVRVFEGMSPPRMVRLSPPEMKRGVRYTHGFYPAAELTEIRALEGSGISAAPARPAARGADPGELEQLREQVAALTARVARLEERAGVGQTPSTPLNS
ncbi:MAG: YceH family protein [Planctomycetota bacterium]|jgi:uncharacterized protein YceH (UPF0502 family)